jgi:thioredoxin-related protein
MYAVKFNAEGPDAVTINGKTYRNPGYNPASKSRNSTHELASYFGVRGYPNLVYLNSDMTVLMPVAGFKTPSQLEFFLKFFTDDVYKTVKTQEEFDAVYQKFVPTFQ